MKGRWFLFFFGRSISQRKGRVVIASLSVTLAVAVVTALAGITSGIREKLGSELKAYGANIIVSPGKGGLLDHSVRQSISQMSSVEDASGQVLTRAVASGQSIEVIGMEVSRIRDMGWRLYGRWPAAKGEVAAGINLRDGLKLKEGQTIPVAHEGKKAGFVVSGFFEKGGAEDSSLIMSVEEAWDLTGLRGKLSTVLVRGKSGSLESVGAAIRAAFPELIVKTSRQVAVAEESLLRKIQLLMILVTAVVLLATAVSVASTMGANVLERREEIGLMKAMGATRRDISGFWFAEAALIGAFGGVLGFISGFLAAEAISKGAFNSFVSISPYLPFLSLAMGLAVSLAAGYFPVRDAMKCDPAIILRGE